MDINFDEVLTQTVYAVYFETRCT